MFFKVYIPAIVVSGDCRQGKISERSCGKVARILRLIRPMLHLVTEAEKEAGVREVFFCLFQCILPAVLIIFNTSA